MADIPWLMTNYKYNRENKTSDVIMHSQITPTTKQVSSNCYTSKIINNLFLHPICGLESCDKLKSIHLFL